MPSRNASVGGSGPSPNNCRVPPPRHGRYRFARSPGLSGWRRPALSYRVCPVIRAIEPHAAVSLLPRRQLPFLLGSCARPSAAARCQDAAAAVARCSLASVAPRCAGGAAGAMRGVRRPPMPGVGGFPMPAVSLQEDDCPFPVRVTQLDTVGALLMRVGLRPDELDGSSSRPLLVNCARTRPGCAGPSQGKNAA